MHFFHSYRVQISTFSRTIDVRLNHRFSNIDPLSKARVQRASGQRTIGHALIAANNIKSSIQCKLFLEHSFQNAISSIGNPAYHVLIPLSTLQSDLLTILPPNHRYQHPQDSSRRALSCLPDQKHHPRYHNLPIPLLPQPRSRKFLEKQELRGRPFRNIQRSTPLIRKLLSYAPEAQVVDCAPNTHSPLPTWVGNKCAFICDSCHSILPYVAQGARQETEDAGVLAVFLLLADELDTVLWIHECVRKERVKVIQWSRGRGGWCCIWKWGGGGRRDRRIVGGVGEFWVCGMTGCSWIFCGDGMYGEMVAGLGG